MLLNAFDIGVDAYEQYHVRVYARDALICNASNQQQIKRLTELRGRFHMMI